MMSHIYLKYDCSECGNSTSRNAIKKWNRRSSDESERSDQDS